MKENEVIKGVECCKMPAGSGACNNCPLKNVRERRLTEKDTKSCTTILLESTLDLINRQKAELEKYTTNFARVAKLIKAEARKEFAERLKECKHECGCNYRKKPVYAVTEEKIDNLVKKMESERG